MEKALVESCLANYMHGFMSMESQAEAYNETFRDSEKVKQFKLFLSKNPKVGKHFDKKMKAESSDDELFLPLSEHFNENEVSESGDCVFTGMFELHRKSLSHAYYNHWVLLELEERRMVGKYFFGPYFYKTEDGKNKLFTLKDSFDSFLANVDDWRKEEIYPHDNCTG